MSKGRIAVLLMLSTLIIPLYQANAAELNVMIFAQDDVAFGNFKAKHVASISYEGDNARELFSNIDKSIEFVADMNTPGVSELIDRMNQNLLELNSPAQFEEVTVNYRARVSGDENTALMDLTVIMDFKLKDLVIDGDTASTEGARTDLNWRGLTIREPVIINPPEVGEIDINSMKGFLEKAAPEIAEVLTTGGADDVLTTPLLDFSDIKELPMSNWHGSFDASGGVAEAERYGLAADVPPVITTYAKGESSFREGQVLETEIEKDIAIDGETAKLQMTIPPAYASIRLAGYATTEIIGNDEYAIVTDQQQAGKQIYESQNLPLLVVGVFAGMAAAIAGIVIWKVNKK